MSAGQSPGGKRPCGSGDAVLPPPLDSRGDGNTRILTFPSPPTQGHYVTGLEELTEFIWGVQRGPKFRLCTLCVYTDTRVLSNTAPEAGAICWGPQISESGVDLRGLRRPMLCRRNGNGEQSRSQHPTSIPIHLPPSFPSLEGSSQLT